LAAKFFRRDSGQLPKLPDEMGYILITASFCDFLHKKITGKQKPLGMGDSGGDYILCAGNSEKGLVQMLQVRAAHTGLTAHFFNRPTALRAMVNLRSQLIQHLETGSLFGMNIIVLKFVFDPIEKNSSQVGQNISLVFGEIAAEFRLDCAQCI
jgi:hypothetical protein